MTADKIPRLGTDAATPDGVQANEASKAVAAKKKVSNWFIINIALADDNEPEYVFMGGMEEGDMRIRRGHDVAVPETVIERLEHAVKGVAEKDADSDSGVRMIERTRYSYSVKERLGPRVNGEFPQRGKLAPVGVL